MIGGKAGGSPVWTEELIGDDAEMSPSSVTIVVPAGVAAPLPVGIHAGDTTRPSRVVEVIAQAGDIAVAVSAVVSLFEEEWT